MRPLYDRAWEKGVDRGSEAPFVAFEALDPDGRVLAGGSKRLWPQCEGVKAALAVYERCGDEAALAAARHLLGGLFATFADPNRPDWRAQVDRDGGLLRPRLPARRFSHLYPPVPDAGRGPGRTPPESPPPPRHP